MNLPPTGEAIVTLIELQKRLHDPGLEKAIAALATVEGTRWTYRPIDMVMHCPACGLQHIDAPEIEVHRSHLCHGCGHIWRPADVPTNGVAAVKTRGQNDSPVVQPRTEPDFVVEDDPGLERLLNLAADVVRNRGNMDIGLEFLNALQAVHGRLHPEANVSPERVRHVVSDREYDLLGDATVQTDSPLSDMHVCRLYRGDDGQYWVRPVREFSARFVAVALPPVEVKS